MRGTNTVANTFHTKCGQYLETLGFVLLNDPSLSISTGKYSYSKAIYETESGLCLSIGFDVIDGNDAALRFGRCWSAKDGLYLPSAPLRCVTAVLGMRFPEYYKLGFGTRIEKAIDTIDSDLRCALPRILKTVSLNDLIGVEKSKFGAETIARGIFGEGFRQKVSIQDVFL